MLTIGRCQYYACSVLKLWPILVNSWLLCIQNFLPAVSRLQRTEGASVHGDQLIVKMLFPPIARFHNSFSQFFPTVLSHSSCGQAGKVLDIDALTLFLLHSSQQKKDCLKTIETRKSESVVLNSTKG